MNSVNAMIGEMSIKQRKDGRYEGRITVNEVRKSFYGKTKSEVKNKAKEYLQRVENGYKEPKKIIFNEYIEYWLKTFKLNKIEPTSYSRLYRTYEKQIKDTIGKKNIGDVSFKDVQKLIDDHAAPPARDIKPLARSGLKRIVHLLRPCMEQAVKDGIIQKNPCKGVQIPKESCVKKKTKKQFSLNDSEIAKFRETVLSKYKTRDEYISRDGFVLVIILNLGLRIGEALALTWDDVDFDHKIIHINKTMQCNIINFDKVHGDNATYSQLKESAKTEAGVRVLHLNDDVLWYFTELMEYDKRNGIKSNYLCSTAAGTLNSPRNLQRSLDRLIKRCEIEKPVTLHTLRHTFGSTLLRHGINIEVVSKLMGHANITITYNKYIHTIQEEEAKAMTSIKIC